MFDAVLICPFWTTLNKMARRGEVRRDLWDLVYVNFSSMFRLCFEHAVIIIDSERNKVGYTLLYSPPLSSYNPSYTAGRKRPWHNL